MRRGDMTQGNIWKLLIGFAIPMLFGNLLQQLYNAFDAIVVGNYVGQEALAAVGSTGPLINMIIAFFMGMSTGSSVLISQAFGAKDDKKMHDTVHTGMLLAIIMGIVLAAVGIFASPYLLVWMKAPPEIIPDANAYLRVYFAGLPALTIYNMGAAILTATGDSRRPLYFLMISTVINIVGNLVFVNVFHMGITGVAWSTVISEVISAVLVVIVLYLAESACKFRFRDLRLHGATLKRIVMIGLPGGVQQAIISFSNIAVQSYINRLGAPIVAGYSAASKLDAFIMLPAQTMAMATTTFVGQNLGAKQVQRARKGTRNALLTSLGITILLSVAALLCSRPLLRIFSPDAQVLEHGVEFMRVFVPFYFILSITQILPGALRGAGDVKFATATCIFCYVVLRQLYLFFVTQIEHSIVTVSLSYPVTWAISAIILCIYYARSNWNRFAEAPAESGAGEKREG